MNSLTESFSSLSAHFPLTCPTPTAVSVQNLIPPQNLSSEHDLSRNPAQPLRWSTHIALVHSQVLAGSLSARGTATPLSESILGPKLATAEGRLGLQKLVDVYERALKVNPKNFGMWRDYLNARSSYVLGEAQRKIKLGAPKKKRGDGGEGRGMADWLEAGDEGIDEGERDIDSGWEGGLDGVVGWEEWRALAACYERALMWLPNVRSPVLLFLLLA